MLFQLHVFPLECGGRIDLGEVATGTIESPDFGTGQYNHSTECIWILSVPADQQASISLRFLNMSLEHTTNCDYDFVEVVEGENSARITK